MRKIKDECMPVYDIDDKGRECARKHYKDIFGAAFNNKRYLYYFDQADTSISKKIKEKKIYFIHQFILIHLWKKLLIENTI